MQELYFFFSVFTALSTYIVMVKKPFGSCMLLILLSGISFFKEAIKSLGMKSDMNMQINAAKQLLCYNRQEK